MARKMNFAQFMQHFYNVDVLGDVYQRLSPARRRWYQQKFLGYKEGGIK